MSLMAHFLVGGHSATVKGFPEPAAALASWVAKERPQQTVEDMAQSVAAPVRGNIGSDVAISVTPYIERIPERIHEETQNVTAFIDRYVPIPWLHGDQKMSS